MQEYGWIKSKSGTEPKTPGGIKAKKRLDQREVSSFESSYVHALWHLDFRSPNLDINT